MKSVICVPKRTAIGSFQGSLSTFSAPQLGSLVIQSCMETAQVPPHLINEVYMGCVLTAGLGQAPARQAALGAKLPKTVPCTTISKVCGSGLKSVMLADWAIQTGYCQALIAGGMESMSQSPYLIPKLRTGLRMGPAPLVDSMINDGLWDVYNNYHMGLAGELCAKELKISREEQDAFAVESYKRAQFAHERGYFKNEIVPITITSKKGSETFQSDEEISRGDLSKFSSLKPAFEKQGTLTAANSSSLSDGAAAMLVCSEDFAKQNHLEPSARIIAQSSTAQEPEWFTTAPTKSIQKLLLQQKLEAEDIDLWEINEAFAVVALINQKHLHIPSERLNISGGAVSLGHPIGASGARILVTLIHNLKRLHKKRGIASLCIGGGEAVSVLVEAL